MKFFFSAVLFLSFWGDVTHANSDAEMLGAIEADNVTKVRRLIEAGSYNLDSRISGSPLIAYAARSNSLQVLRYFVRAKADLNATNARQETALMTAAFWRHERAVELLLAAGAEVESGADTHTALGYAAHAGHLRIARKLLDAGANPNGGAKYGVGAANTPLIMAALSGATDIIRLLLANGADPLIINNYGHDALYYAERDHHKEVAGLLKCALSLPQPEKFEQRCK